ncbi:zinc-binding dehydrogenase [Nocardia sp. NPDC051321]|uniref:zinc-binding dehydrogenase n=1 Tax=Nocardia sp. NPDC051321 TaxID=3364323 RepID=UPI0037BCB2D3
MSPASSSRWVPPRTTSPTASPANPPRPNARDGPGPHATGNCDVHAVGEAPDDRGSQGIGGPGHIAVKIAKALGATVIALTSSPSKIDAARQLGADDVVVVDDQAVSWTWSGRWIYPSRCSSI